MQKSKNKIKKILIVIAVIILLALLCSLCALIISSLNPGNNPGVVVPGNPGEIELNDDHIVFIGRLQ